MLGRLVAVVVAATWLLAGCASSSERQEPGPRELKLQADLDFDAYVRCMKSSAAKHVPATETPEAIMKAARSECRESFRTLDRSFKRYWMYAVESYRWSIGSTYYQAGREAGRQVRRLRIDAEERVVKWLVHSSRVRYFWVCAKPNFFLY